MGFQGGWKVQNRNTEPGRLCCAQGGWFGPATSTLSPFNFPVWFQVPVFLA